MDSISQSKTPVATSTESVKPEPNITSPEKTQFSTEDKKPEPSDYVPGFATADGNEDPAPEAVINAKQPHTGKR